MLYIFPNIQRQLGKTGSAVPAISVYASCVYAINVYSVINDAIMDVLVIPVSYQIDDTNYQGLQ